MTTLKKLEEVELKNGDRVYNGEGKLIGHVTKPIFGFEIIEREPNTIQIDPPESKEPQYYRCWRDDLQNFDFGLIYKGIGNMDSDWRVIDGRGYKRNFNGNEEWFRPVEKPKKGEKYFFIDINGEIISCEWSDNNNYNDTFDWKQGNVFNTEKEAQEMLDIINKRNID